MPLWYNIINTNIWKNKAMYQFLISTQGYTNNFLTELTDKEGNQTG